MNKINGFKFKPKGGQEDEGVAHVVVRMSIKIPVAPAKILAMIQWIYCSSTIGQYGKCPLWAKNSATRCFFSNA